MNFKTLGKSGLRVSEISLGTMTFGEEWGWGSGKEESKKIFDAYADAGGNFIDTANLYTGGTSEKYVGEFMHARRAEFVVATKFTFSSNPKNPNAGGNHRKSMIEAVEASLKRLGTDYIDLYWAHRYDPLTPIDEMMRAFDDLVRQGKVLYIGISDSPAWTVSYAQAISELRGWTSFAALQIEYSLAERTPERDLLPMAEHFGLAIAAWSPLAGGLLSGKYSSSGSSNGTGGTGSGGGTKVIEKAGSENRLEVAPFTHATPHKLKIADAVIAVSKEIGRSPAQVALRWLLQKHKSIIPIIGARKMHQYEDNMKSLEFVLTDEQMKQLDDVSGVELGFPHDFLSITAGGMNGERTTQKMF
ncbi:MAG: aldo/keto reductase [Rhizobacter sp.]|nr:aldo/keto reductase [Chlorobiales bacterium]